MKTPKYRGTLKKWKDDRGFGFIQSDAEGKDIFVHISAFKRAKRRPKVGDAILYDLKTKPDGKVCASNALIEGATFKPRSQWVAQSTEVELLLYSFFPSLSFLTIWD